MSAKPAGKWPEYVVLTRSKGCRTDITRQLQRALRRLDQATAAWKAGRREDGIRHLREAIQIEEACLGPDSAAVATALPQLGAYLLIAGQLAGAQDVLQRGIGLLAAYPVRDRELVAAKALLAEVYLKTDRPALAHEMASVALAEGERAFGPESVEVVRLLLAVGLAAERQGDLHGAAEVYGRAEIICTAGPERDQLVSMLPAVLGALVRLSFAMGNTDRAIEHLDRLLLMLPEDDPCELGAPEESGG